MKLKLLAFALLVVFGIAAMLYSSFDSLVARGIETVGPPLTGTTVEVEEVDISPLSGRGSLRGVAVGNPRGSNTKYAFRLPEVRVTIVPLSILQDKIIVREIVVESPLINYETQGDSSNLEKLTKSVQTAIGGSDAKRLQINRFELHDARVHASGQVLEGRSVEVPPLSVELSDLGSGPEGATVAEVSAEVIETVKHRAAGAVAKEIATLGLGGADRDGEKGTEPTETDRGVEPSPTPTDDGTRRRRRRSRDDDRP